MSYCSTFTFERKTESKAKSSACPTDGQFEKMRNLRLPYLSCEIRHWFVVFFIWYTLLFILLLDKRFSFFWREIYKTKREKKLKTNNPNEICDILKDERNKILCFSSFGWYRCIAVGEQNSLWGGKNLPECSK